MGLKAGACYGATQYVWNAASRWPEAEAIDAGDLAQSLSYQGLCELAQRLVASLLAHRATSSPYVGLLAGKSALAYAGALGILGAGRAYVPLHPQFPHERLARMIARAGVSEIIVDRDGVPSLMRLLEGGLAPNTVIYVPDRATADALATHGAHGGMKAALISICEQTHQAPPQPVQATDPAYLLFTSGSTGEPKGISITHGNLLAYVDWACSAFPLAPGDRCSQTFDLSFDLSVHDLLVTLSQGACLVPPSLGDLLFPAHYIHSRRLSSWFSVPSLAMRMVQMGLATAGAFPSLKYVLFCGEPLPCSTAAQWRLAAPQAKLWNLYGPTEATIACTAQDWDERWVAEQGPMPIGRAFPHMQTLVMDPDSLTEVRGSGAGELWLGGPQVAAGYLGDREKTARAFVDHAGRRWYRSGDRVFRDEAGLCHYLGRIDFQVKIRGYRIELGEIEATLRRASAVQQWVVVPWRGPGQGEASLIACYEATCPIDEPVCLAACRQQLPDYMVPERLVHWERLPLNSNGKVDRAAVLAVLNSKNSATQT